MARNDDTYYEWFDLLIESRQNRPGRKRVFQWKVEPASGFIEVRFLGALSDDRVGVTDEPAVALDITDRLITTPFEHFDGPSDSEFWLIDDDGVLNAFNFLIVVWLLDTSGVNDADFSLQDRKEYVI